MATMLTTNKKHTLYPTGDFCLENFSNLSHFSSLAYAAILIHQYLLSGTLKSDLSLDSLLSPIRIQL